MEVLRQPARRRPRDDLRRGERRHRLEPRPREGRPLGGAALAQHPRRPQARAPSDIVEAHWREYGRNYYARHDYEGIDTAAASGLIDDLRARLASLPGTEVAGLTIADADDFAYHDPVDGSISTNQGIRILFDGGSRVVYRLSGTGTSGATLRVYIERFEADPARLGLETADALADLIAAADALAAHPRADRPRRAGRHHLTLPARIVWPLSSRIPAAFQTRKIVSAQPLETRTRVTGPKTPLGAQIGPDGLTVAVWSGHADRASGSASSTARPRPAPRCGGPGDGTFTATVPGGPGARYGLRADGPYAPAHGHWFDPAKLLVDPYADALDRPFACDPRLAAPRRRHRARWCRRRSPPTCPRSRPPPPPLFRPGGLIYELPVRPFTILHPEIPEELRGTVAALAHPAVLEHLTRLGVDAVELMPIAAWIDERHLAPLGLTNGWGYNPVAFMAPDPRLCPGGLPELAATVAALRDAGIGTILDVVFNHTGESDAHGPTLSLRGLDNAAYFRHEPDGRLVNDAGTGNTLACDHPATRRLVLDALRHFVGRAGVDGFRFDLAPVLGRAGAGGFDPDAPLLQEIAADPLLADRVLIAEPWDIGPGGYQLGQFPPTWLEWNDRYRDRVRRFWRGDAHMLGEFATALAGSSDVFPPPPTRSVNFIAAHDGFTLADLVAYRHKHNEANGEANRDGHGENLSWNNGVEGPTDDPAVIAERRRDLRALLATLFASRGSIMLTAGDEFGRSQRGNNNAYAQDNAITWLDWQGRDRELEAYAAAPRRAAPRPSDARRPDAPDRRGRARRHPRRRLADAGRHGEDRRRLGARAAARRSPWCSAAAATAGSRCSSTAAATRSASTCRARPGHHWPDAPGGRLTLGPRAVAFVAEQAGEPPPEARSQSREPP